MEDSADHVIRDLRKRCSRKVAVTFRDGSPNPFHCPKSPRCEHVWHYDFRVNRQRYRASTETDDKQKAKDIESKERARILDGDTASGDSRTLRSSNSRSCICAITRT